LLSNRTADLSENDESSSIVSGITNLYLNKSNQMKSVQSKPAKNNLFEFDSKSNDSEKLTSYQNYKSSYFKRNNLNESKKESNEIEVLKESKSNLI
jgi:hypothetical protein